MNKPLCIKTTVCSQYQRLLEECESALEIWDEHRAGVLAAAKLHRESLKRPPKTVAEYLATLEQCRLSEFVARLRSHEDEI